MELMLEFEESWFVCIIIEGLWNDVLFFYFGYYMVNNS